MAVDDVDADPVRPGCLGAGGCWGGFDGGCVGLGRGVSVGPVGSLGVVDGLKLALQGGEVGGRWLGGEPAFEGLVEAFDLALGLGWPGWPLRWLMPRSPSRYSKPLRPPVNREV